MKKIGIIDEEGVDKIVATNGALGGVSCITPFDLTIPKHIEEHFELTEKLEDEMGVNCCKVLAMPPDKQGK